MDRLTEWIDDGEERYAIPKMDLRNNGYRACCNKLAEYEDTGLSPDDVRRVNDFEKSQVGILLKKLYEERKKHTWITADTPPETDDYVLVSFANYSIPLIGRFEEHEDGSGDWYVGDCNEEDTCLSEGLFVNGWMALPEQNKNADE